MTLTHKPTTRRALPAGIFRVALAMACLCPLARADKGAPSETARPNIVLIIVDTLRADKLGCYTPGLGTSPELDAIADRAVVFDRVIAQCSWTRPSIASLLTSRYPRTLGIYKERLDILAPGFTTLAETLQAGGYRTVGVTANPVINRVYGMAQGFDQYIDSTVVFSWMRELGERYDDKPKRIWNRLATAPDVFQAARDALEQAPPPYYLQLLLMEVHEYWRGRKSLTRDEFKRAFRGEEDDDYLEAVRQVTHDIAAFITELEHDPRFTNTVFIITSDHGQGLSDHPDVAWSSWHGRLLYESQVIVPLIWYHPGGHLAPRRVQQPVRLLDVMPTLLDYADIPAADTLSGLALTPLLQGKTTQVAPPPLLVTETQYRKSSKIAVYGPEWKLIVNRNRHHGTNPVELQPRGYRENGRRSDQIRRNPDRATAMRRFLDQWEEDFPAAPPARGEGILSEEETEQMEAIGYLK